MRRVYMEVVDGPVVIGQPPTVVSGVPGGFAPPYLQPAQQPASALWRAGISVNTALFIFGVFIGLIIFSL